MQSIPSDDNVHSKVFLVKLLSNMWLKNIEKGANSCENKVNFEFSGYEN